jgi:outer membrane protein W
MGYTVGPSVDYMVTEAVAVGVDGAYTSSNMKSADQDELRIDTGLSDLTIKYSSIGGGAHVKYFFPMANGPINPYLIGGAGATNFKVKGTSSGVSSDVSSTKFGGHGGVGFGYKSSGQVGFGLEADYNVVSTEGSSTQWVGINAVVTFGLAKPK